MALVKASITAENTGERLEVMFNPEEYSLNRDNNFASQAIPGLSSPLLQFAHGNLRTLDMGADLQRMFPSPLVADSETFLAWLDGRPERADAYAELRLPTPDRPRIAVGGRRDDGWWVVPTGEPEPAFAVRAVAELVAAALGADGVEVEVSQPPSAEPADGRWEHRGGAPRSRADNVVVCIDGEHLAEGRIRQAVSAVGGQKVALWLLGDNGLPPGSSFVVPSFDEHWVLDEPTAAAVGGLGARSVVRIALPPGRPDHRLGTGHRGRSEVLVIDGAADLSPLTVEDAVAAHLRRSEGSDARLVVAVAGRALSPRAADTVAHAVAGHPTVELCAAPDLKGLVDVIDRADAVVKPQQGPMARLVAVLARSRGVPAVGAVEAVEQEAGTDVVAAVRELDRRRISQRRVERMAGRLRRARSVPGGAARWARSRGESVARRWAG